MWTWRGDSRGVDHVAAAATELAMPAAVHMTNEFVAVVEERRDQRADHRADGVGRLVRALPGAGEAERDRAAGDGRLT